MKKIILSFIIILVASCIGTDSATHIITVDVLKQYPEKNILVEDIAEIEYIVPETKDDYLFSYVLDISENLNFIIGGNHVENSFIFFSRETGKPVSKINRYGNGPEEYNLAAASVYSEKDDEFFILNYPSGINVYGRDGTYKRKLKFRERSYLGGPEAFYDYDSDNLLFYDGFQGDINDYPTAFVLLSKKDGSITKEIPIAYEKKVSLMFTQKTDGNALVGSMPDVYFAVYNGNDFLLTDYSIDTVYRFTQNQELIPVLIRKPSIQTMEPKTILHSWLETDQYLFLSTNKLEIDWNDPSEFAGKSLLVEKSSGDIYEAVVRMKDYKDKNLILGPGVLSRSLKDFQTGYIVLPAAELLEALANEKLSGKLKEIASTLNEESNPVIMLMKYKKN